MAPIFVFTNTPLIILKRLGEYRTAEEIKNRPGWDKAGRLRMQLITFLHLTP